MNFVKLVIIARDESLGVVKMLNDELPNKP